MAGMGNLRLWLVAALGVVVALPVATFQLDRAARGNSAVIGLVPAGLGGFADQRRVKALLLEDADAAEPLVKAIVAQRPVDGDHLADLALLAVEKGDETLASQALTAAAGRGWRNEFVQISVLAAAALQGQPQEAALRLNALTRTEASEEVVFKALDALLLQPETARELGPLVAESEFLARSVVRFAEKSPERAGELARIVAGLDSSEDALGCEGRARFGYGLLSKGNAVGADLWPLACRNSTGDELAFRYAETRYDPFAWIYPKSGSVSVRMQESGTITVENRDFLRRMVAWRYLTLEPGRYMLASEREDSASATPTGRRRAEVFMSVRCIDQAGREALTLGETGDTSSLEFIVSADCPVQRLRLEVDRGRVEEFDLDMRKI